MFQSYRNSKFRNHPLLLSKTYITIALNSNYNLSDKKLFNIDLQKIPKFIP
ncbi:hypothetical protein LEP1GSC013_1642 [Leptospira interrogans serovar Valbuzzi str. Duyster]|nr:hypothetical protein LEP1GSC013_1642 [Leptospira interrogans serovar Valbuzzi str. Duyster]ENO71936.1 hypothetical protein LEP1GSC012_2123 [Leptospira interrogans serovar Valbuzzi str. Valbuzzi]